MLRDCMHCRLFFHGELVAFFAKAGLPHEVHWPVTRRASVKDVIESLGVPHTEVGSVYMDGLRATFTNLAEAGQSFHVHPHVLPMDVSTASVLRTRFGTLRFLADVNVGRLAKSLRMLGFDTAWDRSWVDGHIAALAEAEQRVVLTKDRGLLKRKQVVWGRLIRQEDPKAQLAEVLHAFGLAPPFAPFSRCIACNEQLVPVDKAAIVHRLQPKTRKYYHSFTICPGCRRIYWRGSHYENLQARLAVQYSTEEQGE